MSINTMLILQLYSFYDKTGCLNKARLIFITSLFSLIGSFIRTWKSPYIGTLTIEQETKALQG